MNLAINQYKSSDLEYKKENYQDSQNQWSNLKKKSDIKITKDSGKEKKYLKK